jgi:hypothetical protein
VSSASRYTGGSAPRKELACPLSLPRSKILPRVGGVAAILVVAGLMAGLLGAAIPATGLGLRNRLVVLFQINAGVGQLPVEPLRVFNPLDVVVLVLVGVTFASLWPKAATVDRISLVIAAGLPFVGIALLVLTHQAGRSSVMGAGLVLAVLMLRKHMLASTVVYLGVLANALLLVGDFATATSAKPPIAALLALGYILLTIWFAAVAVVLLRSSAGSRRLDKDRYAPTMTVTGPAAAHIRQHMTRRQYRCE